MDDFLLSGTPASNREIAQMFGVHPRTVRKHRKALRDKGLLHDNTVDSTKLTIEGDSNQLTFTGLETTNPLDPTKTDGGAFAKIFELAGMDQADFDLVQDSFKFSTWQQSKATEGGERDLVQLYSYRGTFQKRDSSLITLADATEAFRDINKYANPRTHNQANQSGAYVVALSDVQSGKTDESGGTEELAARLHEVLCRIVDHLEQNTYEEIILVDVGDIIENFTNTMQQAQTNDLSLTDQIRFAQRVVLEFIVKLVPYAPKFTYISVPSNHCRVRSSVGNKNAANAPDDDYGILIHDLTKMALETQSEYSHINFVKPSTWEEAVTYTTRTKKPTTIAVTHGHQFSNTKKGVSDWFAGMTLGRRSGVENAEVLLHGHHHSFEVFRAGHGQQVIGCPTIDNGSSWFSNNTGISSPSELLTFILHDHSSTNWTLLHDTM